MKLTAFTQIIVTLAVTAWVFILPVEAVATILVLELALLLYIKHDKMTMAAIGGPGSFHRYDDFTAAAFRLTARCIAYRWSAHAGYDDGVFVPAGSEPVFRILPRLW